MAKIVECPCGAKVRVPDNSKERGFRCPKCKSPLLLTVDFRILTKEKAGTDKELTCPICRAGIQPDESIVTCPDCHQTHHDECWFEIGGCSTYGCKQVPTIEKDDPGINVPLSAWGDTKTCPACGETIKAIALRCRFCDTEFNTVDPLTVKDLRRQGSNEEGQEKLQTWTVALFIASMIGCLAPLTAIVGGVLLYFKRKQLRRCGPVYQVLAYAGFSLSVVYSVLILLFVLFGD